MSYMPNCRPGEHHHSRREIDQAIGVLMAVRRYSAEEAFAEIAAVVRATGVGLGGVSRALLARVTSDVDSAAGEVAAYWDALLRSPAGRSS